MSLSHLSGPAVISALLPIALVGTERSPGWRAALRDLPVPLTTLMQGLSEASDDGAAVALLRAAGAVAVAERVGRSSEPRQALPTPGPAAGVDTRPPLTSPHGRALLQHLLASDAPPGLRREALQTLCRLGWRLPASLLPAMLGLAVQEPLLRPAVAAVMGERGRWLAAQHRRWQPVIAVPEAPTLDDWLHGAGPVRVAFLRAERGHDPAAARERLVAELPQLAARERAELVEALAVGLGPEDEPLLVRLQRDRAGDVRTLAARLLQRLPDSEQVHWLDAQWAGLLRQEAGRWVIDAPEAVSADWKTRGLEPVRPGHDPLGERGWWLCQLVRLTPLSSWVARTGMTPAELLAWARSTDWKDALLRGWRDAALASPGVLGEPGALPGAVEADWPLALLGCGESRGWPAGDVAALQASLPLAARTLLWRRRVEAAGPRSPEAALVAGEVTRAGGEIDPGLAELLTRALVRDLGGLMAGDTDARRFQGWSAAAPDLVARLPAACWPAIETLSPPSPPANTQATWEQIHLGTLHDRLIQILAQRRAWHDLPAAGTPPFLSE